MPCKIYDCVLLIALEALWENGMCFGLKQRQQGCSSMYKQPARPCNSGRCFFFSSCLLQQGSASTPVCFVFISAPQV